MTKNVVIFVGLPGAGKTVLAEKTRRCFPQQTIVFDDPSTLEHLDPTVFDQTIDKCRDHTNVLITDPHLCKADPNTVFAQLREWFGNDINIGVVLFDKYVDACKVNNAYRAERGDSRPIFDKTIDWFASNFSYPSWVSKCICNNILWIDAPSYRGHM